MHGHSYKCEVTFEGDIKEDGMIMDFKKIKEILAPVVEKFDHQAFTKESYGKNPTAENMCIDIFNMVRLQSLAVKKVRLWETDTCYAEVGY